MQRRPLLLAAALVPLAASAPAGAARRGFDELGLAFELPDNWVPVPRAEILEALERARSAGAATEWTLRAAWQRLPHQRWFSLPHLLLESRPAAGEVGAVPEATTEVGRAGAREVHTHRAVWRRGSEALRLTLLAFEDQQPLFDDVLRSLAFDPRR